MRLPDELRDHGGALFASVVGQSTRSVSVFGYIIGIFVYPLTMEFGWSRQEILTASTVLTVGTMLASFGVGWLTDRVKVANLIVVSQLGFGIGCFLLAAFTQSLATYYAIFFLLAVISAAASPITFTKIISARFVRYRGLAIGICMAGSGVCGVIFPPFTGAAVEAFGWRGGLAAVGVVPILVALPVTLLFLRRDPRPSSAQVTSDASAQQGLTFGEALRSLRFWILVTALILGAISGMGIVTSLVPVLIDKGYAPATAASVSAIFGAAVIAGRIIVGALADRIWAPMIATAFFVPAAAATVLLFSGTFDVWAALILIAIIGIAQGAEGDLLAFLTARYFGLKHYGTIFAFVFVLYTAAIGIAPPLVGRAYDVNGSYELIIFGIAGGWLASGLIFLMLGKYPDWDVRRGATS